ncbi:hypothetical protein ACTXJ1_10240 [Brachybacterium alimentarium]|uniref:hypothetical protein n=1 Tax=Brachybacterium alimentarium TaxID=47845 RepID=UPI003FCFB4C6
MTIGSDQLDEWTKTLAEADMLYREVQLLIRLNPEGCTDDAFTVVGVANADGREDADLLHPVVFARRWAWYLAAENRSIPPITNKWVPLVQFISAHLQYLAAGDRDDFADDLRRVRGLLGRIVNENGLARGEADALSAINSHAARKALRSWALTSDRCMRRKDLNAAFPTLTDREWARLRKRKERSDEDIPAYHYPVRWAAEIAPGDDAPIPAYATVEPYRDAMAATGKDWLSLDHLNPDTVYIDRESGHMVYADKGKRKTQENPEDL